MQAARKYNKVVTQMGNQGHSEANYFQFKAWVDAGIIKDVTAMTAHMNSPRRWHGWDPNIKSRSEEHTSELQSLMRISYAVFCLKKKKHTTEQHEENTIR